MPGNAAPTARRTNTPIGTQNPIVSTRAVFVPNAATKKIRPASTTIPIRRGMDVIGKKFAGTAAKSLIGARPTARIPMVTGSIILLHNIAGMALATTAVAAAKISMEVTVPARNTMNMIPQSIQSKSIAASAIPTLALPQSRTIP